MYKTGNYILYKEHMNFRNEPKANGKIIGVIPMGVCIEVSETRDNWGKTTWNNSEGWCCISECFAKPVCLCEGDECCYYQRYIEAEKKYFDLLQKIDKINTILK